MNKWFKLPCYLLGCLLGSQVVSTQVQAEPLIWQATKGQQTLMMIGTVHIGQASMYPLPNQINQFLMHSDGLIVETDINQPMPQLDLSHAIASKNYLSSTQQRRLITITKQLNLDPDTLLNQPPWIAAISLENESYKTLKLQPELGVDNILMQQAHQQGIPLLSFETLAQQFHLLNNLPNDGKDLLTDTLENWDKGQEFYACMLDSWQAGDSAKLNQMLTATEWDDKTTHALLNDRNQRWVKQLIDPAFISPQGKYVIAVGTMHFIGQHSVVALLKQQGYQVQQVSHSTSTDCSFE
ncbi:MULTISPECIES: TraB/GumN family protein [Vibrio]|uniref:TraB/GumN family protein n=1 Tax=Vibrio algicola TaxID=2662262 RepID=A0A5Q0TCM8_9VIBR|nr:MULTISPECIES: TraB/GumN family protein [Vibrio]MBD1574992.1 TraB/GumN family protein [Vibrio sp. S11_S32]